MWLPYIVAIHTHAQTCTHSQYYTHIHTRARMHTHTHHADDIIRASKHHRHTSDISTHHYLGPPSLTKAFRLLMKLTPADRLHTLANPVTTAATIVAIMVNTGIHLYKKTTNDRVKFK